MYEQIRTDMLFVILYSSVTATALLASCYLLLRRANAIAPDITPPRHLRRWTGIFLAAIALNHMWYMPLLFLTSSDDIMMVDLVGGMLDSMTVFPLSLVVMLSMLQDRRRPLWPVVVVTAPLTLGLAACVATHSDALYPVVYAYVLLMGIGVIIYMVRAVRQYGRWLRDNYADLEHKEVWQSFVVLAIILLVFVIYEFCDEGRVYLYAMLVVSVVLIGYLLWRVETLSDLSMSVAELEDGGGCTFPTVDNTLPTTRMDGAEDYDASASRAAAAASPSADACQPSPSAGGDTPVLSAEKPAVDGGLPLSVRNNIEPLLKRYCEESQVYLQHDISVTQLAKQIGTNRSYLSKYFAQQGVTYNAYINGLRIRHFVKLYHDVCAMRQSATTKQLAYQSGFRSYSTFNAAFKQSMGMTATEWMHAEEQEADSAGEQSTSES